LSLRDAEKELIALTNKTRGHLEISTRGHVVYAFQTGFRNSLALRPVEAAIARTFRLASALVWFCFKTYFGVALIVSICALFIVLARFLEGSSNSFLLLVR
jgi:hypothetical protein